MKSRWSCALVLLLGLCLIGPQRALAAARTETPSAKIPSPGVEVAQTISTVTGVAISPLLGMSAVGAWQWVKAPAARRSSLPWFAQPWFWIPALVLVGLCMAKDTLGTAAPTVLKKPMDVAEAVEHKISGLIAAGLFVPLVAMVFHAPATDGASLGGTGLAMINLSPLYNALMIPVALAVFGIVFLASNAINILILLSPFTTVDAALKLFRGALLTSVVATALSGPVIGAVWALGLVLISSLIAGWSFRLSVLGLISLWDVLTFRSGRFTPDAVANSMFLSRPLDKVPIRTYGQLERDAAGRLVFRYRPWLVLPARALPLPPGAYAIAHGLLWSEIARVEDEQLRGLLLLPPRCRSHEAQLVQVYALTGVRPAGLRAVWRWFKEMFGWSAPPATA
jgi:hypothetical protein